MNIEQLQHIVDVAKTGSLTKTAQNAHITLSAVSQSISQIEAELGVMIFARSRGQGAAPTSQGKAIIQKASEILFKIEELRSEAKAINNTLSGELVIAAIPGPMHLLMHAVSSFKKDYPGVRIQIFEEGPMRILEDLHHNRIDLGFIALTQQLMEQNKSIHFEKMVKGKMMVGVSPHCSLATESSVTPDQLIGYPMVLYNDELILGYITRVLASLGDPDILFVSNNMHAIENAVKEGLAVTIGLDYSFLNTRDSFIVPIELKLPVPLSTCYGWVTASGKHASPIMKRFIRQYRNSLFQP